MGLSKDEILNGYYFDELLALFDEYAEINSTDKKSDADDW